MARMKERGGRLARIFQPIRPGKILARRALIYTVLCLLGRAFQAAVALDPYVRRETAEWPEGTTIALRGEPSGRAVLLGIRGGAFRWLGFGDGDGADLVISFKSTAAASRVLTGRIGIDRAFAEHRFTLKGDLALAMSLVRCLNAVEAHLFPAFISRRILKRMPPRGASRLAIYLGTVIGAKQRRAQR